MILQRTVKNRDAVETSKAVGEPLISLVRSKRGFLPALLLVTLLSGQVGIRLARAQQPAAPAGQEQRMTPASGQPSTLTVQSQLVFIPTTVQAHKGGILYGLSAQQFVVEADGVPQAVRMEESDLDHRPLSLVVAVQCSRTAYREFGRMRGLSIMVDSIIGEAPAEVAVVQFGTGEELITNFTHDPARRDGVLHNLQPCEDGQANIYDAVEYATQLLDRRKASGRRAILLISETRDHGSEAHAEKVVEELNRTNAVLDAVTFSPIKSQLVDEFSQKTPPGAFNPLALLIAAVQAMRKNAPKELARQSGGEYFNYTTERGFDRSLLTLANHVNNYYLLSFQPRFPGVASEKNAASHAGPLHSIRVTVPDYPDATVRHRESYWAEAPGAVAPR